MSEITVASSLNDEMQKSSVAIFNKLRHEIGNICQKHEGIVIDCTTKEGLIEAKKSRKDLRDLRLDVEDKRKKEKEFYLNTGKMIDAKAAECIDILKKYELRYEVKIKEEETRVEREREAKLAELERLQKEKREKEEREAEARRAEREAVERAEREARLAKEKAEREEFEREKAEFARQKAELAKEKEEIEKLKELKEEPIKTELEGKITINGQVLKDEEEVFCLKKDVVESNDISLAQEKARLSLAINELENFVIEYSDLRELFDLINHIRTFVIENK